MQNQEVYKKIVWKLNQTKEELEAYSFGARIESPLTEIMIGDNLTEWFLRFCPRGHDQKLEDGISLYLCLSRAGSKEFKAKFTLGVIGTKGNQEHNLARPGNFFNIGWGCPRLLKQDELFNSERGYFVAGKLTLYCKLTISDDVTEHDVPTLSKQSVCSDYKRMLDEELFTDFNVETSDKEVLKAHKGVLAVRSPYFIGMLTSGMKETQENVVKVPENAEIMKAVLNFIYCGEVENLKAIADELVFVAQKYLLDELKELCIKSITKYLSWENAVEMLLAAEGLTDSKELKKKCVDVIASNFEFLTTTADWEKIPQSLLPEITRHNNNEINDTMPSERLQMKLVLK